MNRPDPGPDRKRITGRLGVALLALVAVTSAFVLSSSAAARPARTVTKADRTLPTIVLVHGAWADSSSWHKVITRLQAKGYTVDAPANPLRGLASDSAYLAGFLSTLTGPIVLVGHSYGGAVITNAATGNANVKALVYIDAFAPAQGESLGQLVTAQPGSALGPGSFNIVPLAGGDADLYVKQNLFPGDFANDLPAKVGAELAAVQRPLAASVNSELSGPPAWASIPSWYFVGTLDRVLPPAEQLIMAARMNATTVEVPASHLAMLSQPDAVTKLIIAAAQSVG